MKHIVVIFILSCMATVANAQYTQQLQQKKQGQGTVTVTQSKEIDDLVNGKQNNPPTPQKSQATPSQQKQAITPAGQKQQTPLSTQTPNKPQAQTPATQHRTDFDRSHAQQDEEKAKEDSAKAARERQERMEKQRREAERREAAEKEAAANAGTTIDTRKKVMRRSHKQQGYRVQVFSGGNKREDRIKAEQISAKVKAAFPEQPIYTHFYSPRWICRMGNFKTYDEAAKVLKKVKAMGYKTACVVKGTISVQY